MSMSFYALARPRFRWARALSLGMVIVAFAANAHAQSGSLLGDPGERRMLSLSDNSWYFVEVPPPREIKVHDVVTVIVQHSSRVLSEGEVDRKKKARIDAILTDWIRLQGLDLKPSPQLDGDPRIRGTLDSQYKAEGEVETRSNMQFRIAAEVASIRPNGNLVLEAHQTIQDNDETWNASLSGEVARDKIAPDGTVLSHHIAHLKILKEEEGVVRDSYRRGWLVRFFDKINPF